MMENIIGYVKKWGKYTFSEKPFNEVDSLVLCQLVYLNYEKYVPAPCQGKEPVDIQSILEDPEWEQILEGYWYKEHNKELFELAAKSLRFGRMKMNDYVNVIDEDQQAQFSAMCYFLEDGKIYIAYRGTDATIVGWKEDLNLAFSKPLKSQYLAVEYMERAAGKAADASCPGLQQLCECTLTRTVRAGENNNLRLLLKLVHHNAPFSSFFLLPFGFHLHFHDI